MQYVRLWLDDRRIGCGFRNFFVAKTGRRWVTLFYAPLLMTVKIDKRTFEAMKVVPQSYGKLAMARRISATASTLCTNDQGKVVMPAMAKEVKASLRGRSATA